MTRVSKYKLLLQPLVVATFISVSLGAATAKASANEEIRLSIEYKENVLLGYPVDIAVTFDSSYSIPPIGGFSLLIEYDNQALNLLGASSGEFFTTNGWEYFTYNFETVAPALRIVALAETNDGMHHPYGFTNTPSTSRLFTLHFQVSNDRNLACTEPQIRWRWNDCQDNLFSSVSGDTLYSSRFVFPADAAFGDYASALPRQDSLPNHSGAPTKCESPRSHSGTYLRLVDFRHGGISPGCYEVDARGDINLNGIANEINDVLLFAQYLVQGTTAFQIAPEGQIAATEVNGNGVPGEVSDFVWMLRQVTGDAVDPSELDHFSQSITITPQQFDPWTEVVDISFTQDVSAVLLTSRTPFSITDTNDITVVTNDEQYPTRVLLFSWFSMIPAGATVLHHTPAEVATVKAASYLGESYSFEPYQPINKPDQYFIARSFPNPFNPSTTIQLTSSYSGPITVEIFNSLGQLVKRIEDDYTPDREFSVEWNASDFPTGVYYYRIVQGERSARGKMLLLK